MAVELWMNEEFSTSQERNALDRLMEDLEIMHGDSNERWLVLVNYMLDGSQIDLTILKPDAIIIVELKDCDKPFTATENGDWVTPDGYNIGSGRNPFRQVQQYKYRWMDFLKAHRREFSALSSAETKAVTHVSGIAAFTPLLHADVQNGISPNARKWFQICDISNLSRRVACQTSPLLHFTSLELERLVALLHLKGPYLHPIQRKLQHQKKEFGKTKPSNCLQPIDLISLLQDVNYGTLLFLVLSPNIDKRITSSIEGYLKTAPVIIEQTLISSVGNKDTYVVQAYHPNKASILLTLFPFDNTVATRSLISSILSTIYNIVQHLSDRISAQVILIVDNYLSDETECLTVADQFSILNVPIIALGVGSEWDEDLLIDMAIRTGGIADYVDVAENVILHLQHTINKA